MRWHYSFSLTKIANIFLSTLCKLEIRIYICLAPITSEGTLLEIVTDREFG